MESLLLYIGKAALAAAAFYLAYLALFQHQKQFLFNRIYLPVSLALSFLIPLITFTKVRTIEAVPIDYNSFAYLGEGSQTITEPVFQMQWFHYLTGIYLIGILGFLFYLALGHARAISIVKKSHLQELFKVKVNITLKDVHPFSFFSKIVLSEKTLANPDLGMIVQHENIHVRGKHTIDILFAEILFLFQWFNPFAWLLKDAIKNNLEYLTDHELTKTNDAQQYQLAMVGLAHKRGVAPFLTALNGSQLKNRIIMMKKKTENKYALLKQLVVLPLLAVLVMGLSNKEVKTEIVQAKEKMNIVVDGKNVSLNDPAFKNLDFSGGIDGHEIMLALGIEDKVLSNGMNISENGATSVYFIHTSDYVPGSNAEFDRLISNPEESKVEKTTIKTIHAVDGKILSDEEVAKMDGQQFETVTLLSGKQAVEKYGDAAEDATVVDFKSGKPNVTVRSGAETKEITVSGKITDAVGNPIAGTSILVKGKTTGTISDLQGNYEIKLADDNKTLVFMMTGFKTQEINTNGKNIVNVILQSDNESKPEEIKVIGYGTLPKNANDVKLQIQSFGDMKNQPLYIVDGKEKTSFESVDPNDIESIDVLKNESSIALYGERGKNGVVLVTTKNGTLKNDSQIKIQENNGFGDKKPLMIVDGEKVDMKTFEELNPDKIVSISVLKDAPSVEEYGEEGKDGVILVTTKQNKITSDLELRKFIAQNIKYPLKAVDSNTEATVKLFVRFNQDGSVAEILKDVKAGADIVNLDEIVVVSYQRVDGNKQPDNSASKAALEAEAKRVIEKIPLVDIPELKGKLVLVSIQFLLQK